MRHFIYFRSQGFAKVLSERYQNSFIKETESEIMGIYPINDDVFIVDAHNGGDMSDLMGLTTVLNLINRFKNVRFKVNIISWFPEVFIEKNYRVAKEIKKYDNIEFIQLP